MLVDKVRRLRHQLGGLAAREVLGHGRGWGAPGEQRQRLDEALDGRGVGALVDAVERRDAAVGQERGDLLVGGDHEVLDEAVQLRLHGGLLPRDVPAVEGEARSADSTARAPWASRLACSAAAASRAAASGSAHRGLRLPRAGEERVRAPRSPGARPSG